MKALLCLLSDQHVPNLLSVHHFRPDHLVLVESPQMQRRGVSRCFLDALQKGNLDYRARARVQPVPAEDDRGGIRAALPEAYDALPSTQWIANVTGGTKTMSIATYDFFKHAGGRIVYTHFSQPDRIVDLDTDSVETCGHRPTVDEFVTGYGFRLEKPAKDVDEAKQWAAQDLWRTTATMLASAPAGYDGPSLDEQEWTMARKKGIVLAHDRFAFPSAALFKMWLGDASSRSLTKYEGEFLTGGWLKVFFYNLLSRHRVQLGIWDVALGQSIASGSPQTGVSYDIDVCFMHNHGLAMLECKSGSEGFSKSSGMDTLNKIEAVAQQQGALRVRSFFATTWADVLDKQGHLRDGLKRHAEMYNCTILTREQIRELADRERIESPDAATRIRGLLRL